MPRSSIRSINRPARANPTFSLRCSMLVEPSWERITRSAACSSRSSSPPSPPFCSPSTGGLPRPSTLIAYSAERCSRTQSPTAWISFSVTHAACNLVGLEADDGANSRSPCPTSFSAPFMSKITRESAWLEVMSAMRLGMFALIRPVTTSTLGRWVATTRWIPTARAIWAIRQIASSTSRGAIIIRSASSSITTSRYGKSTTRSSCPGGIRSVSSSMPTR